METIIKSVTIFDPNGPYDGTTKDVHVRDGVIVDIQDAISPSPEANEWSKPGAYLSIGWMDLQADFAIRGLSKRRLGKRLARSTGRRVYTRCAQRQSGSRSDTKSNIAYLIARSTGLDAHLLPMGTVSKGRNGKQLSEMRDLANAGAVAFSDDAPLNSVELLRRALEYAHGLPHPVITCPLELELNAHAQMHEGITSTHGCRGQPNSIRNHAHQARSGCVALHRRQLHFSCISPQNPSDRSEQPKRRLL